jgi:hypothetical protein
MVGGGSQQRSHALATERGADTSLMRNWTRPDTAHGPVTSSSDRSSTAGLAGNDNLRKTGDIRTRAGT